MPEPLVARTRRVDADLDLAALAGSDGILWEKGRAGFAGRGVALRAPLDEVTGALAMIEVDDDVRVPGTGAVAFAALPFVTDPSAELVVPAEIWGRTEDGTRWHTTIGPTDDGGATPTSPSQDQGSPTRFAVEPSRSPDSGCELVERPTKARGGGPLAKVGLAGEIVVTADADFAVA